LRELTPRNWGVSMERRVKEINRFTVGWTAYFALADTRPAVREARQMAASQAQRGALEGVVAPTNALPEPRRARYLRSGRPQLGCLAEGVLARCGSWPLQRALPNAYWHQTMGLKGFTDPYRRFREC
jgi:hypothetical protein